MDPGLRGNLGTSALSALSMGAEALLGEATLSDALQVVADAVRVAAGADVSAVRVVDRGELAVQAVSASASLAAELEGLALGDPVVDGEVTEIDRLSPGARALAERAHANAVLSYPVRSDGSVVGSLELLRDGDPFEPEQRDAASVACAQIALLLRAFAPAGGAAPSPIRLAAEAMGAASEPDRAAERIARLAADTTGAEASLIWITRNGGGLELAARVGSIDAETAAALRVPATRARVPAVLEPVGPLNVASVRLGQQLGVLQIVFMEGASLSDEELSSLAGFAARAAQALRTGEQAEEMRRELERARDLLSVAGQSTAQLSLAHTLDTVVDRVPDLLGVPAVGIYLRVAGRLETAASRGVAGPHAVVAERLLELALGPLRARGAVASANAARDRRLAGVRAAATEAGIESVQAVPLVARGDVIGLLAAYPSLGHGLGPDQSALLSALAGQIAVAVQNALLHEETKQLGTERERALAAERVAARRLSALYEISRSFAQSLSLDRTLDAVGRTLVELLDVDAAVIRLPDERGELAAAQAVHVASPQLRPAVQTIFASSEYVVPSAVRRRLAAGEPVRLDLSSAEELGRGHQLLGPFLERGSTAAVVPMATPSELLATLTLVSLDPGRPITDETLETALSVAGQAALAVDNARLYQQQKRFTDSMQRSLLPRSRPRVAGLEMGAVYESSALVGVGGDVYDYLQIDDGRLAIVIGDVTGHGIDAAADMAMAKFVFRSLARLYPDPADFLGAANNVVVEEIGAGKFITMLCLTIDQARGEVACASAGHPAPRLVHAGGEVESLDVHGLVLGIEAEQPYAELRRPFEPGAAVVLFTDGLVEARNQGELFGEERLDRVLAERHELPAEELAEVVLEECRRFVGGELRDDCAIVVVRRR